MDQLIPVSKGADYLEVHPTCLVAHKAQGWAECEQRDPAPADAAAKKPGKKAAAAADPAPADAAQPAA